MLWDVAQVAGIHRDKLVVKHQITNTMKATLGTCNENVSDPSVFHWLAISLAP